MTAIKKIESKIISEIMRYLCGNSYLRVWRQNTGAMSDKRGRIVRFGVPGAADISGILNDGRRLEIEVKSSTGRESKEQIAFEKMIRKYGGVYIIARSIEDVRVGIAEAMKSGAKFICLR